MGVKRKLTMSSDQLSLTDLADAYQLFNRTAGKSLRTVEWYDTRLALFARFLGPEPPLSEFTIDSVRRYVVHLQERTWKHENNPKMRAQQGPLSSSYIQGHVRALRAFSSWLHQEGHTETNRLRPLRPPKIRAHVIEVLSKDEVKHLLATFDRGDAFGLRNLALTWTMLDCGLRASEVIGLTTNDVFLKEGYLKVLGKGNKERLVPFGNGGQEVLTAWVQQARPAFQPVHNSFFVSANGATMTLTALEEVIKRAGVRAGIPRLTCHLLRHTFATSYLVHEVGDPFRLQQLLGHATLEMVRHYVRLSNVQQSIIERRASTVDVLLKGEPLSPYARRTQPRRPKEGGRREAESALAGLSRNTPARPTTGNRPRRELPLSGGYRDSAPRHRVG